jgi:hypothetical protein
MHHGLDQNRRKRSSQIFAEKFGGKIENLAPIFLIMSIIMRIKMLIKKLNLKFWIFI